MQQYSLDLTTPPAAQARAVGQAAADLAQQRAERADPTFSERAAKHILYCLAQLREASGEVLTDLCKRDGITPADDRAFGAVYAQLVRKGLIRCVGFVPRAKGHGTAGGRVWRLT
jgi:hypothetical protein